MIIDPLKCSIKSEVCHRLLEMAHEGWLSGKKNAMENWQMTKYVVMTVKLHLIPLFIRAFDYIKWKYTNDLIV